MHTNPFFEQDAIHIWQTSLYKEPLQYQPLTWLLSTDETERAAGLRFEADRQRFIVARGTLRVLLGAYLDRSPAHLEFTYSSYGKPSLKGGPDMKSLFFNVSHTSDLVVYAITRTAPVGIDVECVHSGLDLEGIAAAVLGHEEIGSLMKIPVDRRPVWFYRMWTRKEAYCKARGHGLLGDLKEMDASMAGEVPSHWFAMCVGGVRAQGASLHDLNLGADYAAAIAIESDITPAILHQDINMVGMLCPRSRNFLSRIRQW